MFHRRHWDTETRYKRGTHIWFSTNSSAAATLDTCLPTTGPVWSAGGVAATRTCRGSRSGCGGRGGGGGGGGEGEGEGGGEGGLEEEVWVIKALQVSESRMGLAQMLTHSRCSSVPGGPWRAGGVSSRLNELWSWRGGRAAGGRGGQSSSWQQAQNGSRHGRIIAMPDDDTLPVPEDRHVESMGISDGGQRGRGHVPDLPIPTPKRCGSSAMASNWVSGGGIAWVRNASRQCLGTTAPMLAVRGNAGVGLAGPLPQMRPAALTPPTGVYWRCTFPFSCSTQRIPAFVRPMGR